MARPSITGTTAGTAATANATIDVTMTIPAGATALCVGFGGFAGGSAVTVTSVQIDPTGTPLNVNDVTLYNQRGNLEQYAGLYVMYDTNVNWPGTGSVTARVTISSANRQLKACIFCLADVDTAGTPANGTQTGDNAGSTPSMVLTSSSNALNVAAVASYSADIGGGDDTLIYEEQNGASSSSLYVWHEDGASSSDTVEGNASVAWAGIAASFEGTGGGGSSASLLLLNRSIANNGGMRQ
jgi:hypothetical protein